MAGKTTLTIEELEALTAEDIQKLSGLKCIFSVFSNGKHGANVTLKEVKALGTDERDNLANECRACIVAAAKA